MPQVQVRGYQRAYKACVLCRKRKSRCEPVDDLALDAPCKRCKREKKSCVYPDERVEPKKTRGHVGSQYQTDQASHSGMAIVPDPESARAISTNSPLSNRSRGNNPADSVMRTMVSSGQDVLEVLFDPIRKQPESEATQPQGQRAASLLSSSTPIAAQAHPVRSSFVERNELSPSHEVWKACRFVKQGWFSASEALFLVDMFFEHLQKLSPILTTYFSKHERHYQLVSSEPLLCCTILAISARYHGIPGAGGWMRSYYIHERLWTHIQHLILRILLGQEKNSRGKTRTLGTVEALLLLIEWPSRSLSFPPPIDGWDSDLLVHWTDLNNDDQAEQATDARVRWLEDVINPTKRSSHMSWMLTSCAMSLACELGLFDNDHDGTRVLEKEIYDDTDQIDRSVHVQKLLYLYTEQIALHVGRQSIVPQRVSQMILRKQRTSLSSLSGESGELQAHTSAWIDLTQLTRHIMEVLFPSPSQTSQLLHSGRYITLIEHFQPMLSEWWNKHLDTPQTAFNSASADPDLTAPAGSQEDLRELLKIEYYSTRVYCHSLGIQAVVERSATPPHRAGRGGGIVPRNLCDSSDYYFIEEVVSCACTVLSIATQLMDRHMLTYVPHRVTLRIIAASIFLLKGLGLGVAATRLQASLAILQRAISALRSTAVDEMHLGVRYAALLEMHLNRLQNSFVATSQPPNITDLQPRANLDDEQVTQAAAEHGIDDTFGHMEEDWLSLPFDYIFPSAEGVDFHGFSALDDGDLDFLWNLEPNAGGDNVLC